MEARLDFITIEKESRTETDFALLESPKVSQDAREAIGQAIERRLAELGIDWDHKGGLSVAKVIIPVRRLVITPYGEKSPYWLIQFGYTLSIDKPIDVEPKGK